MRDEYREQDPLCSAPYRQSMAGLFGCRCILLSMEPCLGQCLGFW